MRRAHGVLLAIPALAVEEEVLAAAAVSVAGEEPVVGPHIVLFGPAEAVAADGSIEPQDEAVGVLVIDMSLPEVLHLLSNFPGEDMMDPNTILFCDWDVAGRPVLAPLMEQVLTWLESEQDARVAFYSAAEGDTPTAAAASAKAGAHPLPRHLPDGSMPKGGIPKPPAKPKKPTLASLSTQLESLAAALPALMDQVSQLTTRQATLEKQQAHAQVRPPAPLPPSRASLPISSLLGSPTTSLQEVARVAGPPPRTKSAAVPRSPPTKLIRNIPEDEPEDLDGEPLSPQAPYAEALLEQSRALAALVAHFQLGAHDPMSELANTTSAIGVKGAVGREKLQRELSLGNGQFFLRVAQSMSRRMSPTSPLPQSTEDLAGVSMLSYLEKFGGFGQNRSLGLIMWSLGHVFDSASKEQWGAVKDHLAMTIVMIDQANQDGGDSWHLPWLLRLLDDPPTNLWMNRNTSATGARRPFAPLVAQSWATVALAYLKETEVLTNKKQEVAHPTKPPAAPTGEPKVKAKPKRKPWAKQPNNEAQGSSTDL